jgi:hypothetical protein
MLVIVSDIEMRAWSRHRGCHADSLCAGIQALAERPCLYSVLELPPSFNTL